MPSLKERWFPKGFRRTRDRYFNRVARRTTTTGLAESFARLDIETGAVICLHSALSRLGHLVEGPESVIKALCQAVPDCTVMMPSFPFSAAMHDYVASKPVFDPRRTPSMIGLMSEAFRNMPGVRRGLHPTHPCAALGPRAEELIVGAELSAEPFGDRSTYGRFSSRSDAVVLLIHTNHLSIMHRCQEIVGWPNLFLPQRFAVDGLDEAGARRTYSVRVHTPNLPQYLALAADDDEPTEWIWLPNYMVQFPQQTARRLAERLTETPAKCAMVDRQADFFATGTFRRTRLGAAEILAIRVKPWQQRICQDLRDHLAVFGNCYTPERLQAAYRMGRLTH